MELEGKQVRFRYLNRSNYLTDCTGTILRELPDRFLLGDMDERRSAVMWKARVRGIDFLQEVA